MAHVLGALHLSVCVLLKHDVLVSCFYRSRTMGEGCTRVTKYFLFVFNLIFFVSFLLCQPVIYAWPHVKMSNDDPFCTRASSLTQPSPTLMGKRMYLMYSDVMQRKRLKLDPNLFFLLWTDTRMHHTHSLTEGSKQCPRPSAPLLKSPLSLFISTAVWGCHHGLRSLAPFRQSELLSCPA